MNPFNPFNWQKIYRNATRWESFTLQDSNYAKYLFDNFGNIITPEQAKRCTTVFSCVRLLSDTVAQLPLKLKTRLADGDREDATSDPLYKVLLYNPNTWQTAFDYWKWNTECLCYRGWFISLILYSGNGKVNGLLPLHPDTVQIKQNPDGTLSFRGNGAVGPTKTVNMENIQQKDVFFCMYATSDGVSPVSPISFNAQSINLAISASNHGTAFLENDATPPLVIEYPNRVDPEGLEKLAKIWKKKGTGGNYGLPKVVEAGAKVNKLSISNQDAQYLELRQFEKEEICGIFGVPVHMISDTKQSKGWSTVEMQGIEYVTYTMNPWFRRIEQSIVKCLIPRAEWGKKEAKFTVQALLRGDTRSRTAYYQTMRQQGALNANEIRQLEDMNRRQDPNADEYWIPANINIDNNKKGEDNALSE